MGIGEEKRIKDARRKVMFFVFVTACDTFCLGLFLAAALRHPNDLYYYFMVLFWLLAATLSGLLVRRELSRILSPTLASQTTG